VITLNKKILLLGPPGTGKGTQAEMIIDKYLVKYISTGNMFRQEIKNNSDIGMQIKNYILNGQLVPDEVTNRLVNIYLNDDLLKQGFIMDGYPRTVEQAKFLDDCLNDNSTKLDAIIFIDTPLDVILNRITQRRCCTNCNAIYHLVTKPPKIEGYCDACNGELVQRMDDKEDVVKTRLEVYGNSTSRLKDYYGNSDGFCILDGTKSREEIFFDICNFLDNKRNS